MMYQARAEPGADRSRRHRQTLRQVATLCLALMGLAPVASAAAQDHAAPAVSTTPATHVLRRDVKPLIVPFGPAGAPSAADANAAVVLPAPFTLDLFPDARPMIVPGWVEASATGAQILHGWVDGAADSEVTMVEQHGAIAANVRWDGQHYQVRSAGEGRYTVEEIEDSGFDACLDAAPPELNLTEDTATALNPDPAIALDSGALVDLLVVYTSAARSAAGGVPNIESIITLAVSETNTGLGNSAADHRVRLVHMEEVTYAEGSGIGVFTTSISRLRTNGDGFMDNVHTLRNTYGADQVMLVVHDPSNTYCGVGYVMTAPASNAFAAWAFSVVAWPCAVGNYSFAHELGHNWGAHHDRANTGAPGTYSYSYGYQQLDFPFRTIMAYNSGCSCTRVNHWSNPDVSVGGDPTGVDNAAPDSADNRLTLNNNAIIIANWRDSVVPVPPTDVTLSPDRASPDFAGNPITFTAAGVGGTGPYEYEFALQGPGTGGTMTVQQAYATTATWTWGTAAADIGDSTVRVRVRNVGSAAESEASRTISYTVSTPPPAVTGATLAADVPSPQDEGTSVTFTGGGLGGSGTYEYEFSLQGPGTGGVMTVQRPFSTTATWTWNTTGHGGANTVRVSVRNAVMLTPGDVATTMAYTVIEPVDAATLGGSVASPQAEGTPVTLTGVGSGGTGVYEYQFWQRLPNGAPWVMVQDYGVGDAWAWDTTGAIGTALHLVYVRNVGSTAPFEAVAALGFTVDPVGGPPSAPVSSVTLTPNAPSPQEVGTVVTFTAQGMGGGGGGYEYQFWHRAAADRLWTLAQNYSATSTWTWDTTGLDGTHYIVVYARNAGTTVAVDAFTLLPFQVIGPVVASSALSEVPAVAVTLSAALDPGDSARVDFRAAATGSTGPYEYQFWRRSLANTTWQMVRGYATTAGWTWDTTGFSGSHVVVVYARAVGSTAALEGSAQFVYEVGTDPDELAPAAGVTVAQSPASPQVAGTTVTFMAQGAGGSGTYEYRFRRKASAATGWTEIQPYSATNVYSWNTAGQTGSWDFQVDVRNQGATVAQEASSTLTYVVTPTDADAAAAATGVTVTTDLPSPQAPGVAVRFAAQATGPADAYEYAYWQRPATGGAWTLVRGYASAADWTWDTTGMDGAYLVVVYTRAVGSTAGYEATTDLIFTIATGAAPPAGGVATGVTLGADVASPQALGAAVVFDAVAEGDADTYDYQFWLRRAETTATWAVVQPYGPAADWTWDTSALASGAYVVAVYVRATGSAATLEASATVPFTLEDAEGTPLEPVTDVTLTASLPSPQDAGGVVSFTAEAGGGSGAYEYAFWRRAVAGGAWVQARAYAPAATWSWDTTGAVGAHVIVAYARSAGSGATFEAAAPMNFTIEAPSPMDMALAADQEGPQAPGAQVRWQAAGPAGAGPYEYQFWLQGPATGYQWQVVQTYSASDTWTWDSTGAGGTHTIAVWAREAGAPDGDTLVGQRTYDITTALAGDGVA